MKKIWITWERQNRSINLAKHLDAQLYIFNYDNFNFFRYPICLIKTSLLIAQRDAKLVFVQNPSMVLTIQACILRLFFRYKLVVDRHSNFMMGELNQKRLKYKLFQWLSKITLKQADITLVTNRQIADRVVAAGGRPVILPDPLPDLTRYLNNYSIKTNDMFSILFPCSWSSDEPLREVATVCKVFEKDLVIYVTGKPKRNCSSEANSIPPNFIKTGYLSDHDYFTLMAKCHVVMPLTIFSELLVCGGYEGVSLEKPLILGDSPTLREFFYIGAVYAQCTTEGLAAAIKEIKYDYMFFKEKIVVLHEELRTKSQVLLDNLKRQLNDCEC